ncbi:MAG: glycosyltransferase family 4 protein, partial [Acidobacteria bacterium]|nr:glycosyltransferase family 4 protein [Acidobacteriota bacterium]
VLLEVSGALDRQAQELFLIATHSQDARWRQRWEQAVDHVYDLQPLIEPERLVAAVYSIAINWEFDAVLIQNSLAAYSAIPHLRRGRPGMKIFDLIHAVDPGWDFVSATAPVAGQIDRRVVISGGSRERLLGAGTPEENIRLIRNGIDLERFCAAPTRNTKKILFAGRLDPVKRPLLLLEIAAELARLRPVRDFHFVIAGDGPESAALRSRAGGDPAFTLLGHADDMPPLLAEADVVVIPSQAEGIPLVALEAFAVERPVVCSRAGAAAEVVSAATGALIEPGAGEAARFAAALHALLDDPQRRTEMGRAGRRLVEAEYNRDSARRAYRELFLESCSSPPRHQDTKKNNSI